MKLQLEANKKFKFKYNKKWYLLDETVFYDVKRVNAIDAFRGFLVFCMLIFQFAKNFPSLGFISKLAQHNVQNGGISILPGFTIADFVAPAFIFAIGLTMVLSFVKRKKREGVYVAFTHSFLRGLAIIGVGTFLDLCNNYLDFFGDSSKVLNYWDFIITVIAIGAIISLIIKIVFSCIKSIAKEIKLINNYVFYSCLATLGIINIVMTSIDYAQIVNQQNQIFVFWVTLQTIGIAIVIATPFLIFNKYIKLAAAIIIGILYSVYHQLDNNSVLLDVQVHGGIVGGFGWASILLFSMFIGEVYYKNKYLAISYSAIIGSIGILLTQSVGLIRLDTCSPTFILTTVGLSGIIFGIFNLIDYFYKLKFTPFIWWGKNPIIMFLLEFFVLGLYGSVAPKSMLQDAPTWLAAIQVIIAIVLLTAIAYGLSKSKKTISL